MAAIDSSFLKNGRTDHALLSALAKVSRSRVKAKFPDASRTKKSE